MWIIGRYNGVKYFQPIEIWGKMEDRPIKISIFGEFSTEEDASNFISNMAAEEIKREDYLGDNELASEGSPHYRIYFKGEHGGIVTKYKEIKAEPIWRWFP